MKRPGKEPPLIVVIAGPNGAGKTTFFNAHLSKAGLRFVNADLLAKEMGIADPYTAAGAADALRRELVAQRESFVFETVFSDPEGDKLRFLREAVASGYRVVLCFIAISSARVSDDRVAMRVSQGGHDVPTEKLRTRYPRTLANLKAAIPVIPEVRVFSNDDLRHPFRKIAVFENGRAVMRAKTIPPWLASALPQPSGMG